MYISLSISTYVSISINGSIGICLAVFLTLSMSVCLRSACLFQPTVVCLVVCLSECLWSLLGCLGASYFIGICLLICTHECRYLISYLSFPYDSYLHNRLLTHILSVWLCCFLLPCSRYLFSYITLFLHIYLLTYTCIFLEVFSRVDEGSYLPNCQIKFDYCPLMHCLYCFVFT